MAGRAAYHPLNGRGFSSRCVGRRRNGAGAGAFSPAGDGGPAALPADALERSLHSWRRIHSGRLLVLFGCGGNRDRQKRPLMAKAAVRWADGIVITDDNPRGEAPETIRREVAAGLPKNARWREIAGRRQAIEQTMARMQPGDLLLLAGKGHEG